MPILILQYTRKFIYSSEGKDTHNEDTLLLLEGVEVFFRSMKLPIDTYMFYQYMMMIYSFTSFKAAKLRSQLIKFSCLNKFVIFLAFLIGVLLYYTTVSYVVYITILFLLPNKEAEDK